MQLITKEQFFELIATFEWVPYTQTYGWFAFSNCEKSGNYLCLVDAYENPKIACFAHIKKAAGFKLLVIEGECLLSKNIKSSLIKTFYEDIRLLGYDMVEINSNSLYNSEFEVGIRRAGFLRPVGSFSVPLSKWINLTAELTYNSNWTRNTKKSLEYGLKLELYEKPCAEIITTVVNFYNQFTKEKGFTHKLDVTATSKLLTSENFSLAVVTNSENTLLSCIIFHHIKEHAGLLYAAKSSDAKENGATFFMYNNLLRL